MKDELISRETAIRQTMGKLDYVDTIFDKPTESEIVYMLRSLPSVPAVPLDKLCEWLAGNAWHLDCSDCDGEYCDCPQWHDDSGSSPAFWKAKLTKWMEEQNENK